ncbi:Carbon storage regulator [Aquisphaera giovannonii]|uniref:Translational regulator CsrA n=1 Tax=Aquisphaera giovannonii TaxID=406548 RepID=A0A5B9W9U7_9BACT|nr:Carbon storage regulator [Aquisphaera giovannonii]
MLVLTRKLLEKLYIGDNICVTVVRLEGGQVRLGIEAPRSVNVVRAELVPERDQHQPWPEEDVRADAPTPIRHGLRRVPPPGPAVQEPTRRGSWNR